MEPQAQQKPRLSFKTPYGGVMDCRACMIDGPVIVILEIVPL